MDDGHFGSCEQAISCQDFHNVGQIFARCRVLPILVGVPYLEGEFARQPILTGQIYFLPSLLNNICVSVRNLPANISDPISNEINI